MKLSLIIFHFSFVFLLGCKSELTAHKPNVETKIAPIEESYKVIYKSQMSSKKTKEHQIITSNEELSNLVSEMNIDAKDYTIFLNIDFKKYNLLAYYLGEKPTGGYDVVLNEVKETKDQMIFSFKETVPTIDELTTSTSTSPCIFVQVLKNKKIVLQY